MIDHNEIDQAQLIEQIKAGKLLLGGNKKLKIYGTLSCKSGKRMLRKNRVFFELEEEAITHGYRPCGHCMRKAYLVWKSGAESERHK